MSELPLEGELILPAGYRPPLQGKPFKPQAFGGAWQTFSEFDGRIRNLGAQAGATIDRVARASEDLPLDELKTVLKTVLPGHMKPYVDLADETGKAFYTAFRGEALGGATIPSNTAPTTMNVIDQDGEIISARARVGITTGKDVFDFDPSGVGKSVVPARSWESAVGGAFKGAEDVASREGKFMAVDQAISKLIGYGDRRVQNVYRDQIERIAEGDPYSVGWQRLAYAGACAFCRMLAGRGAVYKTNASASFVVGRGVVRKVRGRPKKRGRKYRSWERPDTRQIRELHSAYHDNCQCKVIPRFTFNGAEMPLPPLMQFMQDKYNAEYYTAKANLLNPPPRRARRGFKKEDIPKSWKDFTKGMNKAAIKRAEEEIWGIGRRPHIYDYIGLTKWSKKTRATPKPRAGLNRSPHARDILRLTRKNNMSARQRRFMPTRPHDYMIDELASGWPGSPYMSPKPMRFTDFAQDYGQQLLRGAREEGGILLRRKGNQFVGRVTNKYATRTQRRINRKIDQIEGLPAWGNRGLKALNAEARRKSTRAIRYNAKQGLKYVTGETPTWNFNGLIQREAEETIRFHVGQSRRTLNRHVNYASDEIFQAIKTTANTFTDPVYSELDRGSKLLWGWGRIFTNPVEKSIKKTERRIIRRAHRPFKRRATRLKRSYAKGGSMSRAVQARTGTNY